MFDPVPRVRTGKRAVGWWVMTRDSLKEKLAGQLCAVNTVDLELKISIFCVLFCTCLHRAQHLEAVSSHLLVLPHVLESDKTGDRAGLFSTGRPCTTLPICWATLGLCCCPRVLRLRWAGAPSAAVHGLTALASLVVEPTLWAPYWRAFGWGWDDLGEWHWNMYNIICETNCQSRFHAWYRIPRAGALGWPRAS